MNITALRFQHKSCKYYTTPLKLLICCITFTFTIQLHAMVNSTHVQSLVHENFDTDFGDDAMAVKLGSLVDKQTVRICLLFVNHTQC